MPKRILIIDDAHDSLFDLLREAGFDYEYQPSLSRADLLEQVHEYEGVILRSKTHFDKALFDKAHRLEFIARAGSGIEIIDLAEAARRGVQVVNAPEGNRDAVAEHAMGMLLVLLHRVLIAHQQVQQGLWKRAENRGTELKGKVVALIGYGHVGSQMAKRLSTFDCEVLAYDQKPSPYTDIYAREASMEEVFERADILSLHVSMNEANRHLVNESYLERFRKPIILLNTSRGEVLSLAALCEALRKGKVWAAALDVLENEKINQLDAAQQIHFDFLRQHPAVLLTPHIAGWTWESYRRINEVLVKKIAEIYAGTFSS